jgi:nucleotide-binding universal stress UspA family protein
MADHAEHPSRRLLSNVLVATDVSSGAEQAVARALRLPYAARAKLSLLHVVPSETESPIARGEAALLASRLEDACSRAATAVDGASLASIDIVTSVTKGKASSEIVRAAREQKSELIVLGRHGKSAASAVHLGSTAKRVIRRARASVLVVSRPARGPYQHPLVAVDFSETSRLALDLALRLTDPATPSIAVVHAHLARQDELPLDFVAKDCEQEARTRLEEFLTPFAGARLEWSTVIERGDPREVIVDVAAARGCDLVVLGARGHSAIDRFLIGSVAEAVVCAAGCDVLLVRPPADSDQT